MTRLARRVKPAAPAGPPPPVRMEAVTRELGDPPTSFGVDPDAAKVALERFLRRDKGSDRPFCTCGEVRGWSFDHQVGVYIHADARCWKPSKGVYEAALRAGLLGELPLR